VAAAGFARLDADVWKDGALPRRRLAGGQTAHHTAPLPRRRAELAVNAQPGARIFSAARARHPRIAPRDAASSALQQSRSGGEILARNRRKAQLRRSPALRTVAGVAPASTYRPCSPIYGLEHGTERRARKVALDQRLLLAGDPALDDLPRILGLQTVHELRAQSVGACKNGHVNHAGNDNFGDVGGEVAG